MKPPKPPLQLLVEPADILAAQQRLEQSLQSAAIWTDSRILGSRGGARRAPVWWIDTEAFWYAIGNSSLNRWTNGFGVTDPRNQPHLSIGLWINPPKQGVGSRASAAYVRDAEGAVYLCHTGRVGGGKKGVGKRAFLDWLAPELLLVESSELLPVAELGSPSMLHDLATYLRSVLAFKAEVGAAADDGDDEDDEAEDGAEGDVGDDASAIRWPLSDYVDEHDPGTQRVIVAWLEAIIREAHALNPSGWSITRTERRLRLLVGHAVAFEVDRARIGVGLHRPSLPDAVDTAADAGRDDAHFTRVPGGILRRFSPSKFVSCSEALRPASQRFVELVAPLYRTCPNARFHADYLVDELATRLGRALPQPAHSGVDAAPSYWMVTPGDMAQHWPQCRDGNYIAMAWRELGDLGGLDRDGFDERLARGLDEHPEWKRRNVEQLWRFINIPPEAKIVVHDGAQRVVGIGTVTGRYQYVSDGSTLAHRLSVEWTDVRERVASRPGRRRALVQLPRETFDAIMAARSPDEQAPREPLAEAEPPKKLDFRDIMDRLDDAGLHFPEELVASYLLALQAKRFVILSGISGTGKTQLALAVATSLQPSGSNVEPIPATAGSQRISVQPYMLKFRRMVIPAALAVSVRTEQSSGDVEVRFDDGRSERLRTYNGATATQLLFKGAFREWFERSFEVGDELELELVTEDPPVLRIGSPAQPTAEFNAPQRTYEVIAVRPDWTDSRGLLGYYNPITREYNATPLLRLLLAAHEEERRSAQQGRPRLPFFAILDEMNLARVEHYFSDFLSCLESGEPLHLHDDPLIEEGGSESGELVPMRLSIPRNVFFTGTVNVDETTYMFSPKVLDRAFVLEFNDVNLDGLGTIAGDDADVDPNALRLDRFEGALDLRETKRPEEYAAFRELLDSALHVALVRLNQRLETEHRHFGYRVANEIARFVGLARAQGGKEAALLWEALDVAIVSKVLPKLHGTQQEVEDILERLLAFAVDVDAPLDARDRESRWSYAHGRLVPLPGEATTVPRLPRAAAKLWRMLRRVRQRGYVSFIE